MADGIIEQALFGPLAANRGYSKATAGTAITNADRCLSCAKKNFTLELVDQGPSGKQKRLNYHPHREILEGVCPEDGQRGLPRKASSIKTFFPTISDSTVGTPISSAALVRRKPNKSDKKWNEVVERAMSGPSTSRNGKGKPAHHHYHIHTHHHYPKGSKDGVPGVVSESSIGVENPWLEKQAAVSRAVTARMSARKRPDTRPSTRPTTMPNTRPTTSKSRAAATRPPTRAAGTMTRPSTSRLVPISRPTTSKKVLPSKKSSLTDSSSDGGSPDTLPRINAKNSQTVPNSRKNSKKGLKPARPVVSGKRKHSNPVRKITPPKRKMTASSSRKVTPPKKVSDASNPITSTNLPSTSRARSVSRGVQTPKHKNPLTGGRKADLTKPRKPLASAKKNPRKFTPKSKLGLNTAQNFVVHSPHQTAVDLIDRIKESRERKGYPYTGTLDGDDPPTLTGYPNRRDDVDIFIDPHAPSGSKMYEDVVEHPRQKWFPTPEEAKSYSSPNSPLRRPRTRESRMDKTVTTQTRTFQKDGLWFEETVETTVVENKDGSRTTTKTTTKQLPGPPKSAGSSQRARSTSSSSRSPSPQRQVKKKDSSSGGGLFSRFRTKKDSSSSSDDDQDDIDKSFSKDVLEAINEKRSKHGVKGLKMSSKLTHEARQWAKHLASKDKMQHKQDQQFGENIYRLSANLPVDKGVASGKSIVDQWYSESDKHKFGQEPSGAKLETGHFTQIVWKDSKELGVGIALSDTKRNIYVVAFFSPKGNWMGEFATKVPPIGGFLPSSAKKGGLVDKISKVSVTSGSSSSDEEEDFNEAVLKAHNQYRSKHGVPPLKISKKLNKFAEEWATKIAKRDRMEHRPNNEYGENLYAKWNSKPNHTIPGSEAVESWYSEITGYPFGREPTSLAAGHFTQVIWEDSKELGIGLARNKSSGKLYVVCNYEPAGNMVGSFAKKVPPPKK